MAAIKSFTSLEQSKKLAEILPLESADMCWQYQKDRWVGEPDYEEFPRFEHATDKRDIPCWSLAALLGVLPYCPDLSKHTDGKWYITTYPNNVHTCLMAYDNPIDACVAMVEKLYKIKML